MHLRTSTIRIVFLLYLLWLSDVLTAQNQSNSEDDSRIRTFFSVVHPIVSYSKNAPSYNFDGQYEIGFPTGVNFIQSEKIAFSIELVPSIEVIDNLSRMSGLLFHPGIIYRNIGGFNFLTRLAFNTNGRYGFTLVANKPIIKKDGITYFLATPIPIRFGNDNPTSLTIGFQFGVSF
ncbi:hypothetical protein [Winogradskyella sp.]|uniref:hypothetical protein n=1 Tax=Winogradskyella sp. TaxID=1883156 RepID=UPI0026073206|nr:hypothetical protein [Winogradskyella sp.]